MFQFNVNSEFNKQLIIKGVKFLNANKIQKFLRGQTDFIVLISQIIKGVSSQLLNNKKMEMHELPELELLKKLDIRLFNDFYQKRMAKRKEKLFQGSLTMMEPREPEISAQEKELTQELSKSVASKSDR